MRLPPINEVQIGNNSDLTYVGLAIIILLIAAPLIDLAPMIVPGNKKTNRFGPVPGKTDTTAAEHF